MTIKMDSEFCKIDDNQIVNFESKFNLSLPEDYRFFLLNHTGGIPSNRSFITRDTKIKSLLKLFYPLSTDFKENLEETYSQIKHLIPKGLLPIGRDPVNNFICLSCLGDNHGCVYYWNKDGQENDRYKRVSYKYIHFVSSNFNELLDILNNFCFCDDAVSKFLKDLNAHLFERYTSLLTNLNIYNNNEEERKPFIIDIIQLINEIKLELYKKAKVEKFTINKWKAMTKALCLDKKENDVYKCVIDYEKRWDFIFYKQSPLNDFKYIIDDIKNHLFVLRYSVSIL